MRNGLAIYVAVIMLFLHFLPPTSLAGQVVTDELRQWAKDVLAQEKQLDTSKAKNTVAVLYFQNLTSDKKLDPLKKGITLMLITDLSKVEAIRVVERVKLQALLEEMRLDASGLAKQAGSPEIGSLLGAGFLVGGDILSGSADKLKIQSSILQILLEKEIINPVVEGKLDELFRLEKEILFALVEQLELKLNEAEKAVLNKPLSMNTNALLHLFQAVDLSDRGEYKRAAKHYKKALNTDPDLGPASDGLEELYSLGLASEGMDSSDLLHSLRGRTSATDQLETEFPTKRSGSPQDVDQPGTDGDLTITW